MANEPGPPLGSQRALKAAPPRQKQLAKLLLQRVPR
jgi:hypothetical protein